MLHLLIISVENMNPDDFKFTRLKVKVTRIPFVINYVWQFPLNVLNTIDYKAFRHLPHTHLPSHIRSIIPLLWHEPFYAPTPLEEEGAYCFANVGLYVGQTVRLSVDQMVSDHYLQNNISQGFHIPRDDWSW